jgi:TonB family protein
MGLLWVAGSLQAGLAEDAAVSVERFEPVKPKHIHLPDFAWAETRQQHEGWVMVSTMVDAHGKPYETAVESSTGNPVFERAALAAIAAAKLEPALLDGQPIESVFRVRVMFYSNDSGRARGARPIFGKLYEDFGNALKQQDQAAAQAILKQFEVTNLYEDAMLGLAQYRFAVQYQDELAEMAGLKRAVAYEGTAEFLPRNVFLPTLRALFVVQVRARYYGEALDTWGKLQKVEHDAQVLGELKKTAVQVEQLRSDPRSYATTGALKDGRWYISLFRQHFQLQVTQGHVTDLRVRCEKKYLTFPFDPQIEYRVESKSGKCYLEVEGDPGSLVTLIQS